MKVKKEEKITRCFVLTDKEIERISRRFDDSHKLLFRATCADDVTREFTTVDELVTFENPPNKEIESLGISISAKNYDREAFIRFSRLSFDNILIRLEGDESDVFDLKDFFHERLYATSPWYAFISRTKYSGYFITVILCLIFVTPVMTALSRQITRSDSLSTTGWAIVLGAISLALSLFVSFVWDRTKKSYFPMGVFSIGQGAKRHQDQETIRTTVIVGFLVSLIASLLILLLYR